MEEHYIVVEDSLLDMLNMLDNFQTKLNNFLSDYPRYEYSIKLYKEDDVRWKARIKIIKDEESDE